MLIIIHTIVFIYTFTIGILYIPFCIQFIRTDDKMYLVQVIFLIYFAVSFVAFIFTFLTQYSSRAAIIKPLNDFLDLFNAVTSFSEKDVLFDNQFLVHYLWKCSNLSFQTYVMVSSYPGDGIFFEKLVYFQFTYICYVLINNSFLFYFWCWTVVNMFKILNRKVFQVSEKISLLHAEQVKDSQRSIKLPIFYDELEYYTKIHSKLCCISNEIVRILELQILLSFASTFIHILSATFILYSLRKFDSIILGPLFLLSKFNDRMLVSNISEELRSQSCRITKILKRRLKGIPPDSRLNTMVTTFKFGIANIGINVQIAGSIDWFWFDIQQS